MDRPVWMSRMLWVSEEVLCVVRLGRIVCARGGSREDIVHVVGSVGASSV